jgi:hypothetical protein
MNDVAGREITVGDEIAFTVSTRILTGKVTRIYEGQDYGRLVSKLKVELTTPEPRGKWGYRDNDKGEPVWQEIVTDYVRIRTVFGSDRAIILRGLEE